ncbi:hypothetical protein AMATHDRAFT_58178 [Amanita thiersii Skay4041]|uniref:PQ-loop-domain-containing protein n=1 Tax=Amanita thiersii Skay4041 TaxID=703135 RepID=A0A2A9NPB8_9AGAR|nr:hypothetical protein AMATHDRAFT_58178 [Amanita thiersii Skay4041]
MPVNAIAENVLGTIGTICWTAQLVPQIWKSWREKKTDGLSPWLVWIWGVSGAFLGTYVITLNLNYPLILQPQLFSFLTLISWGQCLYYSLGRSKRSAILMTVGMMVFLGGFEVAMVYAVKPSFKAGNTRPVDFFGIFSSVLVAIALLPQYYEIYKHKQVVGLSIMFMVIDTLGGIFSDLSLAFKEEFDAVAGVAYTLVVVMDGAILIAALILNPRAARRRKREAEAQATFEDGQSIVPEAGDAPRISTPRSTSPSDTTVGHGQEQKTDANPSDITEKQQTELGDNTTEKVKGDEMV